MKINQVAPILLLLALLPSFTLLSRSASGATLPRIVSSFHDEACAGGIRHDGEPDTQGVILAGSSTATYVMKFNLPQAGLAAACICFDRPFEGAPDIPFDVVAYDDDGPSGSPGTYLGSVSSSTSNSALGSRRGFVTVLGLGGLVLPDRSAYVGVRWNGSSNYALCTDTDRQTGADAPAMYFSPDGFGSWRDLGALSVPGSGELRIRVVPGAGPPVPPAGPWLTTPEIPGFRFKALISDQIPGQSVLPCSPETLCISGALPQRPEVFVRIAGPRPNGFLWPSIVKFTPSKVKVWLQDLNKGTVRYYVLDSVGPESMQLPGLIDRQGFSGR